MGSGHFRANQEHRLWSCMTVSQGWTFAKLLQITKRKDTRQKPALPTSLESMNGFMFQPGLFERGSQITSRNSHATKAFFFPTAIQAVYLMWGSSRLPSARSAPPHKSTALLSALRLVTVTCPCRKLQKRNSAEPEP